MSSVLSRLRTQNIRRAPSQFQHNGQPYPFAAFPASSLPGSPVEVSADNYDDLIRTVHQRSSVVAGAVSARSLSISQLRFQFRSLNESGKLYASPALAPLVTPGPDLTRQGLLSHIEADIAYAGNFYVRRLPDATLRRLRPDWMSIVIGSNERPSNVRLGSDAHVVGYIYKPGGTYSRHQPQALTLDEVAHFAPEPHPTHQFLGEAWVTAVWREVAADIQATDHVSKFFDNAATANMIVKPPESVNTTDLFDDWVSAFDGAHRGAANAWRNIYVQAGSDVQVVGSNLGDLAMKDLQGGFETRVSTRSRVPATMLLIREGLGGSAMNAGNYAQTRRMWADSWFTPYAESLCASLGRIIDVPSASELTYDPRRVLLLQEDQKDAADIAAVKASTIRTLVDGGFEAVSAVEAVEAWDMSLLVHTGKLSVQLIADSGEIV